MNRYLLDLENKTQKMLVPSYDVEESPSEDDNTWKLQKKGMSNAILCQVFGVLGTLAFKNGFMLAYFKSRGISDSKTLLYLSLPFVFGLGLFFIAFMSDKKGKKKVGYYGALLHFLGFLVITISSFLVEEFSEPLLVMAVIIFSIGETFFGATWFSLMHPVVPEFIRGRFWGKLRLTWQSMGIIFFLSSALLLGKDSSLRSYQIILSSLTLAYAVRVLFYRRIPELDKVGKSSTNLLTAFRDLFNNPKYLCFCGYVFIVIFFSQGSLRLFSLIEKQVLNLADGYIVGLGVCMMVGMVLGFYLSGKLIDRFGTKELFLICHLSFAFFILMFVFRMGSGLVLVIFLGIITLLFGITRAGTSVAITSEMMGLIPEKNKSLSISVCITMVLVSSGLSGIMNSIIIKLGVLRKHWEFAGFEFSNYDSILLGYSIMLFLLISTIGLVPAIISDSRLRYIGKV